jgi:hypothetical protein
VKASGKASVVEAEAVGSVSEVVDILAEVVETRVEAVDCRFEAVKLVEAADIRSLGTGG